MGMLADMNLPPNLPPFPGVGLKPQHYAQVLQPMSPSISPPAPIPAWLEIHPQNYFGAGGPPHLWLSAIAESFPLSFHSVGRCLVAPAG